MTSWCVTVMKYLTPERYVEINQASDDEVERLYDEWNAAGAEARAHLRQIKSQLPPKLQQFCETFCLHDADVVGIEMSGGGDGVGTPVAIISVRQENELLWLIYDLYDEPAISRPVASDLFAGDAAHRQWLYDEVDLVDECRFRHEILLSTGEVIDLLFFQFDMFVHRRPSHTLVQQSA